MNFESRILFHVKLQEVFKIQKDCRTWIILYFSQFLYIRWGKNGIKSLTHITEKIMRKEEGNFLSLIRSFLSSFIISNAFFYIITWEAVFVFTVRRLSGSSQLYFHSLMKAAYPALFNFLLQLVRKKFH